MKHPPSTHFFRFGSPLDGLRIPRDWVSLDLEGKRRALVANGYAVDYSAACGVLSKHGAAVRAYRKAKAEAKGRKGRGGRR